MNLRTSVRRVPKGGTCSGCVDNLEGALAASVRARTLESYYGRTLRVHLLPTFSALKG